MIREIRVRIMESATPDKTTQVAIVMEDMNDDCRALLNVGALASSPLWQSPELARAVVAALYMARNV